MNPKTIITINSAILYVLAFLISTILHELAHALTGSFFNSSPVLHHNYVEHLSSENLSVNQLVLTAFAGPALSLFQGFLAGWAFLNSNKRDLLQLFLLWFSFLGFNNFLGYIMTGPLFQVGDIGKIYALLNFPIFAQILIALIGAASLLYLAYKLTRYFLEFSYREEWIASEKSRRKFSFSILFLPWIIGSASITLLYLPIIALISIIYPISSGMILIYPWQNATRITNISLSKNDQIGSISIKLLIVLIIIIVIFKWVLAPGIAF